MSSSVITVIFGIFSFVFKSEETDQSETSDVPIVRLTTVLCALGEVILLWDSNYLRKYLPTPPRCAVLEADCLDRETGDTVT